MEPNRTVSCTVLDGNRFICYTNRNPATFSVCLTDAADVWRSDFTEESLKQFRQKFDLNSADDFLPKLRSACVSVVLRDGGAELRVDSGSGDQSLRLSRLEAPGASEEIRELLFKMADALRERENSLKPWTLVRPQHSSSESDTREKPVPSVPLKKRPPGASLINPGAKRKLQATGVSFDDDD